MVQFDSTFSVSDIIYLLTIPVAILGIIPGILTYRVFRSRGVWWITTFLCYVAIFRLYRIFTIGTPVWVYDLTQTIFLSCLVFGLWSFFRDTRDYIEGNGRGKLKTIPSRFELKREKHGK